MTYSTRITWGKQHSDTCKVAGCRAHGINRETGTLTQVLDAQIQNIDADSRWVAVCVTHGFIIDANNQRDAMYLRAHPIDWCGACQERNP